MTQRKLRRLLNDLYACDAAQAFAASQRRARDVWEMCPEPDWLFWLYVRAFAAGKGSDCHGIFFDSPYESHRAVACFLDIAKRVRARRHGVPRRALLPAKRPYVNADVEQAVSLVEKYARSGIAPPYNQVNTLFLRVSKGPFTAESRAIKLLLLFLLGGRNATVMPFYFTDLLARGAVSRQRVNADMCAVIREHYPWKGHVEPMLDAAAGVLGV